MGVWNTVAVYFGLADETEQSRQAYQDALLETSPVREVLRGILAALLTGIAIGLIRCLVADETVTVGRVIEYGWLVAAVVLVTGAIRELWDRHEAIREG